MNDSSSHDKRDCVNKDVVFAPCQVPGTCGCGCGTCVAMIGRIIDFRLLIRWLS